MNEWLRTTWSRLRAAAARDRLDREFDEELATHLQLLVDEYRRKGLSDAVARREAIRRLGWPDALRESHRDERGVRLLDVLLHDLRYAVRALWRTPAFAAIALLSLALGIGANTALFSLIDDLLLRSLAVRQPHRLVQVQQVATIGPMRKVGSLFTAPVFDYVRARNDIFSEILGFSRLVRPIVSIDGSLEPHRQVDRVSANYFRDLGVTPAIGRTPQASDDDVAVVSDRFWRARFGAAPSLLGRSVAVDGKAYTVVGVAPRHFLGLIIEMPTDLWLSSRTPTSHLMIARLRPEITPAQAQAASQVLFRQLAGERPDAIPWIEQMRMEIVPAGRGLSQLRAQYERPLLALGALVTLVLLITCTNIGTLLMVRNNARRRELAVRASLGAGRSRLVLQHLLESTVLATLGGLVALIVARWGVSALLSMLPLAAVPEGLTFQIDGRILAFTAGMTLFAAVLFGLAPAWRAGRVNLADALRSSQGTTATRSSRRLGRVLVAFQVGLSVLLLIGTGLFVQTLRNLDRLNVGFNADQLLQVVLDSTAGGYRQPGQVGQLYTRLLERVAAIPGVRSVTGARMPLMHGIMSRTSFRSLGPGRDLPPGDSWDSIEVGPSFFETMNIPLLRGRLFTRTDFDREQTTIIVNESFARHYFPGADPTTAAIGEAIVGVVGDAKIAGVRREAGPIMFFMARAADANRLDALQVRITGEADAVARAIQAEISRVDPRLFVGISTMRQEIDRSIATERMVAATSAFFSVLALLLVSIGIFGVASSNLVQRTSELAIRMALGAGRWKVICESLRDTLLVFAAGMAGGIIAAVVAVRLTATFLSDLLFGLSAADAANMAGAVALMVLVAVAACALPARRATRIDPLAAIRHE